MFQKRAFVAPLQSYEKRAGGLHARNGRPEGFKTFSILMVITHPQAGGPYMKYFFLARYCIFMHIKLLNAMTKKRRCADGI